MADVKGLPRDLVPTRVARLAGALAAVAAVLGTAACGAGGGDQPATASAAADAATPALAGDVAFPRTLQADRWVEIRLTGAQSDEWLVTGAALTSPYFADAAPVDRNVRLFAGSTAHVRVPLGAVTCPAGTDAPYATLNLASDAGAATTVTVQLPGEVLAGINTDECAVKAVTDAAAPAPGKPLARQGTAVSTTLTLTRGTAFDGVATLTDLKGSVIFTVTAAEPADMPAVLDASAASVDVPVTIDATRCDQHAFAESKKTFVFAVWIAVDGAEPTYVEVRPGEELKAALQEAFDSCGESTTHDAPGGA